MEEKRIRELAIFVGELNNIIGADPNILNDFIERHPESLTKTFFLELYEFADIFVQLKRVGNAENVEFLAEILQQFEVKKCLSENEPSASASWIFPALRALGLSLLPHHYDQWIQEAMTAAPPDIKPILEALKENQYDKLFLSCKQLRRQYVLEDKFVERIALKLIGLEIYEHFSREIEIIPQDELASGADFLLPVLDSGIIFARNINASGCAAKYAFWKGNILHKLQGLEAALPHFRNALEYYEPVIDHIPGYDMLSAALNDAIFIELAQNGKIDEGLPYLESAINQYRHAADREPKLVLPNLARAMWNIAKSTASKGDLEKVDKYYTEAATHFRKVLEFRPDVFSQLAEVLFEHMVILQERNEYKKGIDLAQELAFRLFDPPKPLNERLRILQISAHITLGDLYFREQSPDLAEKYHRETLAFQTAFTNDFPERDIALGQTLLVLATTLLANHKIEEAKELLIKAKTISNKWLVGNPENDEIIIVHAEICTKTGQCLAAYKAYDIAEDQYLESFNLLIKHINSNNQDRYSGLLNEVGNNLVDLYFRTGKSAQTKPIADAMHLYGGRVTISFENAGIWMEKEKEEQKLLDNRHYTLVKKLHNSNALTKVKEDIEILEQLLTITEIDRTPYTYYKYRYFYGLCQFHLNDSQSLEKAIQIFEEALIFFPKEKAFLFWLEIRQNLALAYRRRKAGVPAENLEKAIEHNELLLAEIEENPGYQSFSNMSLINLGVAYRLRLKGDNRANLEKSLMCFHKVISFFSKEDQAEMWARAHLGLTNTYKKLKVFDYKYYGQLEKASLDEAASVNEQKVEPILWAGICTEIATLYRDLQYGNIQDNLQAALRFAQKAVDIYAPQDYLSDWAEASKILATVYLYLEDEMGKAYNIDKGIEWLEKSIEASQGQPDKVDLFDLYIELGQLYSLRISGIPAENMEKAIKCCEKAFEITEEPGNDRLIFAYTKLGTIYQKRILGDPEENLEQAIRYLSKAEKITTAQTSPKTMRVFLHEIGLAYSNRKKGNPSENLNKAIQYFKTAAAYTKALEMTRSWGLKMISLASLYLRRKDHNPDENKKEAGFVLAEVLSKIDKSTDFHLWFQAKLNLSITYLNEDGIETPDDLECAKNILIELESKEFLSDLFPSELGSLYGTLGYVYSKMPSGRHEENISQALDYYDKTLAIFSPHLFPEKCFQIAWTPAHLHFEAGNWQKAGELFDMLVQSHEFLYAQSLFLSSKTRQLSASQGAFIRLAYAKAKSGKTEEAIWALEKGKSQYLNQVLQREGKDLSILEMEAPELMDQYKILIRQRSQLESWERDLQFKSHQPEEAEDLRRQILDNDSSLQAITNQINEIIGESERTISHQLSELGKFLEEKTCIVCPITTNHGTLIFLMKNNSGKINAEYIELDSLTSTELTVMRKKWEKVINLDLSIRQTEWEYFLDEVGLQLGQQIFYHLTPLFRNNSTTKCVLITFQEYSYLPLHLAYRIEGGKRKYFMDDYIFSYAPSIRIWMHCKKNASLPENEEHLLAIEDPRPTKAPQLTGAALEVAAITGMIPGHTILRHGECTQSNILDQMRHATCSHFSCHGHNRWDNPLLSQLLVSFDESLHLKDILNLPYSVSRLATLSACETGLPGLEIPDEVIGLPTGLIQAGFSGVIASIWSVPDFATALLMIRFYWLWRKIGLEVDSALQQAQIWVRNSLHHEKAAFLEKLIDFNQLTYDPNLKIQPVEYLNWLKATPFENAYYEPKNWGAFYLMGY